MHDLLKKALKKMKVMLVMTGTPEFCEKPVGEYFW